MKKIYIAGKVSGECFKDVVIKFTTAYSELEMLGFKPVNPVELVQDYIFENFLINQLSEKETWEISMKVCIKELITCDAVVLLPCWQQSKGARIERQLADDLNIPIFNYNKYGLEVLVKNLE